MFIKDYNLIKNEFRSYQHAILYQRSYTQVHTHFLSSNFVQK